MELKTEIIPCEDGCSECNEDIRRYNELIEEMSSSHLEGSKDPVVLCSDSFKMFKKEYFLKLNEAKGELFDIASRHGLSWTEI